MKALLEKTPAFDGLVKDFQDAAKNQAASPTPPDTDGSNKTRYRSIWISDVHLGTKDCQAEFLTSFLKAHRCDQLYLVGDIFDGWKMKSGVHWPQAHSNVIRRVLTMAKRGTQVTYITGNHDEVLRKYSEFDLSLGNIRLVDEAVHETADGRRLLMLHGDQFDGVATCHRLLAFIGDKSYELLMFLNRRFNALRRHFNLGYWSLSTFLKNRVKRAVMYVNEFEHGAAFECRKRGYDGIICGHIHHPANKMIDGVGYYNCGDWVESCTALAEDEEGRIHLIRWTHQGDVEVTEPVSLTAVA